METKHTPGPWEADETNVMTAVNAGNKHVAMVNISHQISVAEHEANAKLIAAAPELLTALIEYVAQDYIAHGYDAGIGGGTQEDAEAAIAKATK